MRSGMILSKLDKQVLSRIVTLVVDHTGIGVTEGTFRYTVKDITRQLAFGGDFTYGFGDFFKLIFIRFGIRRSEEETDKYDTLFHFAVEMDNMKNVTKEDVLYKTRRRIADEAEDRIEEYLKENGLAIDLQIETPPRASKEDDTPGAEVTP